MAKFSSSLGALFFLLCLVAGFGLPAKAAGEERFVLVMLGDSITAGFGLAPEEALPVRLEAAMRARGHKIEIRNAGISGDTSAGGAERVDWSLSDDVSAVLVALGGNDALRAIPPGETEKNLASIITQLKERQVPVLLAGMLALPNYGPDYGAEFEALYPRLAKKYNVPLYPFLLEGVAADPALNQEDGIHPNQQGVSAMVARMVPFLEKNIFQVAGTNEPPTSTEPSP